MIIENIKRKYPTLLKLTLLLCVGYFGFMSTRIKVAMDFMSFKSTQKVSTNKKDRSQQTVVVLYSNQRSGSSFTGDIFARNQETFYLFEPLYPFTPKCKLLVKEREEVLENILKCNFDSLRESYKNAKNVLKIKYGFDCVKNTVCSPQKQKSFLQKYTKECMKEDFNEQFPPPFPASKECGFPLKEDLLSDMCNKSPLIVYKVLRACSLSGINDIYKKLKKQKVNMFVIHLVRDPRAITNSRLRLHFQHETVEDIAKPLCTRLKMNAEYAEDSPELVEDGRYMRIRYEEISSDPIGVAGKMYNFIGKNLPDEVSEWLKESTNPMAELEDIRAELSTNITAEIREALQQRINQIKKELASPFSTTRQTSAILERWRRSMTFDKTQITQTYCKSAIEKLGYKMVYTVKDLKNYDVQLF